MKVCEKHSKDPVIGYSSCFGCEIERLIQENKNLKQAFKILYDSCAIDLKSDFPEYYDKVRTLLGLGEKDLGITPSPLWAEAYNTCDHWCSASATCKITNLNVLLMKIEGHPICPCASFKEKK